MVGSGTYLIGSGNEFRGNVKALGVLREVGAREKVWLHTMEVLEGIRGS